MEAGVERPKILIATFGSLGDLHPFVALGHALAREGFAPVIATSAAYADFVLGEGLGFAPIRPDADDLMNRLGMDLGEIAREMAQNDRFLFETLIFPHLRESFEDLYAAAGGAVGVVAHSLAFAGRVAAEARGLPCATILLSPLMAYSPDDPPAGSNAPFLTAPVGAFGRLYNRALLWSLSHAIAVWAAPLRRLRRDAGLAPRHGLDLILGAGSSAVSIGLFSPLLAPRQKNAWLRVAGHSFHDRYLDGADLDPALDDFLNAGAPPIVFTLGSFVARARRDFYLDCIAVAQALGRRAVLLAHEGDVGALAACLPPEVFVAAYAPHSRIFPRACAIVHHGGIGTSGQALRSGRPQVVTPFLGDQFDNAERLRRLGVARVADGRAVTPEIMARELLALDPRHHVSAEKHAAHIRQEDGAAVAARWIGELFGAPGGGSSALRRLELSG